MRLLVTAISSLTLLPNSSSYFVSTNGALQNKNKKEGIREKLKRRKGVSSMGQQQGDQIGQFIVLWATFQSLWQQLFCPNCPHF